MIKTYRLSGSNRKKILSHIDSINNVNIKVPESVIRIINDVRKNGDKAVKKYTQKFDRVAVRRIKVSPSDIRKAKSKTDKKVMIAVKRAAANIRRFHLLQRKSIKDYIFRGKGYSVSQQYMPVESAGLYIPGGQAPLFSTVLMAGIPAVTAGVKDIAVVSPPSFGGDINPYIIAAADMIGIKNIYRAGGAQAVAALAYGTKTIPAVDKIAGPGNIYSTMAKKYLYGRVGIDCINGPSEITIIADSSASPAFIACDLMAQAEHTRGHALLLTDSEKLAGKVKKILKNKAKISVTVIIAPLGECVELANYKAPEHLQVVSRKEKQILKKIKNAPAVFAGKYSAVAFGDYVAGSNHILPTNGTARYASALSVIDFLKHSHTVRCSKKGVKALGKTAELLSRTETLENHAASIKARRI